MVQAAEPRRGDDRAASAGVQRLPVGGRFFSESEMSAVVVIVTSRLDVSIL